MSFKFKPIKRFLYLVVTIFLLIGSVIAVFGYFELRRSYENFHDALGLYGKMILELYNSTEAQNTLAVWYNGYQYVELAAYKFSGFALGLGIGLVVMAVPTLFVLVYVYRVENEIVKKEEEDTTH